MSDHNGLREHRQFPPQNNNEMLQRGRRVGRLRPDRLLNDIFSLIFRFLLNYAQIGLREAGTFFDLQRNCRRYIQRLRQLANVIH